MKLKKILMLLLAITLIATLTACDGNDIPETTLEIQQEDEPTSVEIPEPDENIENEEMEELDEENDEVNEEQAVSSDINGAIHRIEYGDNVVYLFGTMHGGREAWYPLADVVEDAMNRADVFVTEFGFVDPIEQVEALQAVTILPDEQTWVEFLPEEAYNHMVEMAELWELVYEDINTMNPMFLIFSIELELLQLFTDDFELGSTADVISVDYYVIERATTRELPILGLETVEQQAQILHMPPFEVIVARVMEWLPPEEMVEAIINNPEPGIDELADIYETNDFYAFSVTNVATLSLQAEADAGGSLWIAYMREYVMNWRSTYYANEIARLLQETEEPTTFFVAVGLSHIIRSLSGEEFTDIVEQLDILDIEAVPIW